MGLCASGIKEDDEVFNPERAVAATDSEFGVNAGDASLISFLQDIGQTDTGVDIDNSFKPAAINPTKEHKGHKWPFLPFFSKEKDSLKIISPRKGSRLIPKASPSSRKLNSSGPNTPTSATSVTPTSSAPESQLFVRSPGASGHDSSSEVTANLFRKGGHPMSGSVSSERRDSPHSAVSERRDSPHSAESNTSREHKNSHSENKTSQSEHKTSQSSVLQSNRSTFSAEDQNPTALETTSKTKDTASESLDTALTRFVQEIDAFAGNPSITTSQSTCVELPKSPLPIVVEDTFDSLFTPTDDVPSPFKTPKSQEELNSPNKRAAVSLETTSLKTSTDELVEATDPVVAAKAEPEIIFKAAVESFEILHMRQHLTNPRGLYYFQECLREHFAAENLHFWKAVQDLQQVSESSVLSETKAIFDSFFSSSSNSEINISYIKKQKIVKRAAANDWTRDMYDEISTDCFKVMTHYWVPHYRPEASSSVYYKNFLLERMGQPTLPMPVIKPPGQF